MSKTYNNKSRKQNKNSKKQTNLRNKRKNNYNKTKKGSGWFSSSSSNKDKTECQQKLESYGYKDNYGFSVSSSQGKENRKRAIKKFYDKDKENFQTCEGELNLEKKYIDNKNKDDPSYEELKKEETQLPEVQNKTYKQGLTERLSDLGQSAKKTQKSISQSSLGKTAYKGLVSGQTAAQLGYFFAGFPNNMTIQDGEETKTIKPFQNLKDNLRILSLVEPNSLMKLMRVNQEDFDRIKKMTYSATGEEISKGIYSGAEKTSEYISSKITKLNELASQAYCQTKLKFTQDQVKWLAVIGKAFGENFNAEEVIGTICNDKLKEQIENPNDYLIVDSPLNESDKKLLFSKYLDYCFINRKNVLKYYKNEDDQSYGKTQDFQLYTDQIIVSTKDGKPKIYLVVDIDGNKMPIIFYQQEDKLHVAKYEPTNIYKEGMENDFKNTKKYKDDSPYRNDFLLIQNFKFLNKPTEKFENVRKRIE